jgi:hypothetical protein
MIRFYLRALGISTLKSILLIMYMIGYFLYLFTNVPFYALYATSLSVYLGISFLFAEWLFSASKLRLRQILLVAIAMYLWETSISILVWSWIVDQNQLYSQNIQDHLIYVSLHLIACVAAWYVSKRFRVTRGMAEGLEA